MKLIPKRKVIDRQGFSAVTMSMLQNINNNMSTLTEELAGSAGLMWVIDGGGSVITTGEKGHLPVPFNCEIKGGQLFANQSGSIKIDIWKDIYTNFPPADADSICGGNELEISSNTKDSDLVLTGWNKAVKKFDILAFNVDSCTDIQRCTVILYVDRV